MKISDKFKENKVTISFELFPPKPGMAIKPTEGIVEEIAKLNPDFMSVTYGAGGSNSKNTVAVASYIQSVGNVTALAHLTCIASTKDQIKNSLMELKENNIENVLALRGDIPQNLDFPLPNQYHYAYELIEDIHKYGDFCVGAACYPECHTECENQAEDILHLKQKVESGCDFLTTQMFFDNTALYSFLYRTLSKGIDVPIIAGIMPVTNGKQIERSCALSGATLPNRFKRIVDKFGDDQKSMKQAGIAYATEQIIDLIANGIKGIHVYTMNKPEIAKSIMNNLSDIIGK